MGRLRTAPPRVKQLASRVSTLSGEGWRAGKGGSSTARGYGYRWQQYRLRFLAEHPLCAMCKAAGRVEAATIVDHKQPHRGDDALFWDADNHQPLCKRCHDGAKQREEARHG